MSGKGDGQLFTPTGVKVDSEDNVWLVDRGNSRVQKFIRVGEFLATWDVSGDNQGHLGFQPAPLLIATAIFMSQR